MVVTHPWWHGDTKPPGELERCGCSKILLGFGRQAAKSGPSPASVHRGKGGGQGCARGWEGRSRGRVSAGALDLAAVCCLPTARLAPGPASLVGKPEISISKDSIWQFCKGESGLRSRLTVAGVLLRALWWEESHFASNENFIPNRFGLVCF